MRDNRSEASSFSKSPVKKVLYIMSRIVVKMRRKLAFRVSINIVKT